MSMSGPASAFDSETFGQDASFHLEQPVGSMTISPSGRDVALASKEGLHIIDLDSPYSPPRYLAHRTPWEVADVQWSPFAVRDYWVVSTSNQKALLWNLGAKSWQDNIELVLHAHTRAITDINFSAHNPDVLATCAVDSFVHCWDLRAPVRPAYSFSDWFAGATQVKWSRQDEHVIASSHDKFLHIWDNRHGAHPVRTIEAHATKVYGIDWNRFHPHKIVTCGLDRTLKFWDTDDLKDEPERVIDTPFPVWRARHTPFGWGIVAMPQRGSSELYLYDRRTTQGKPESGHVKPVARFGGHVGQVKEFLWRARGSIVEGIDHRDFQLISWGTDHELRLHRVDNEALEGIGYEKGRSKTHRLNFTRRGARYRTFRDFPDDTTSPLEAPSRGESLPSQHQLLYFRKRTATSVGMSKIPASQIRGWVSGKRKTSRIGMHGKGNNNNEINPIAWLKNVKIGSWDPDTLAEEIKHVGEKFRKVEFETVDVKHRKLVMSLQAPWSEHQSSVYLRIDIRFPQSYPRGANAIVTLQRTGAITEELHKTLSTELRTIAEVYASRNRGCLEAILRYVLREQSLEQIVNWVMGESLIDSKIIDADLPAEDSSDSDDDQLEGLGNALASSANIRVPLAKGCGALWSETGKLVCFFPPKPIEAASVLGELSVRELEKSDTSKLFEGFGRLHTSSPARKSTKDTQTAGEDSDSESSSSQSLSSSSSSASSSAPVNDLQGSLLPYHRGLAAFHRGTRSVELSNRSTTMAGAKSFETQRQTIVSIHEYDDLMPSKKDLAQTYKIVGPGPAVCRYNAKAAAEAGREDLSSVWNLANMILTSSVPLALVSHPADGAKEILVIAKQASSRLKKKDSGVDLSGEADMVGQIRWGLNPLASAYLIPAMFDYFERIGDIQMLAMLSCIFANSASKLLLRRTTQSSGDGNEPRSTNDYYASPLVAASILNPPPELEEYVWVPSLATAQGARLLSSSDEQAILNARRSTTFSLDPASASFHDGKRRWSRAPSMSAEDYQQQSRSAAISLSTSPEGARLGRANTNMSLSSAQQSLSALTQSFSHSPPTHGSSSGGTSSLKRYSPSSSLTPNWALFSSGPGNKMSRGSIHHSESSSHEKEASLRSSASLANVRNLVRDGYATPPARLTRSYAPSDASEVTRRGKTPSKKKVLRTTLRNQNKFDLDGHVSVPLLDPRHEWKYKGYRANYAQLLEAWQLHVQRAEIMKIDAMRDEDHATTSSPLKKVRKKTVTAGDETDRQGLRIRRCCPKCGEPLAAIEKNNIAIGWHCVQPSCSSRKTSKRNICSVCCKIVSDLSVPCLECGHSSCWECAQEWFAMEPARRKKSSRRSSSKSTGVSETNLDKHEDNKTLIPADAQADDRSASVPCPAGCGCVCSSLMVVHIPYPPGTQDSEDSRAKTPKRQSLLPQTKSHLSTVSQVPSLVSRNSADRALNTFLAITRARSVSEAKSKNGLKTGPVVSESADTSPTKDSTGGHDGGEGEAGQKEPLLGFKGSRLNLGALSGGRGLREKGSESTIRGGQ